MSASIMDRIAAVAAGADAKYGDFASMHEAYGVLLEEVAELFDEVRRKERSTLHLEAEAIDIAAVALRIAQQAHRVTR